MEKAGAGGVGRPMRCPVTIDWVEQETHEDQAARCASSPGTTCCWPGPLDDDEEGRLFGRYRCSRCGETATETIPEEGDEAGGSTRKGTPVIERDDLAMPSTRNDSDRFCLEHASMA